MNIQVVKCINTPHQGRYLKAKYIHVSLLQSYQLYDPDEAWNKLYVKKAPTKVEVFFVCFCCCWFVYCLIILWSRWTIYTWICLYMECVLPNQVEKQALHLYKPTSMQWKSGSGPKEMSYTFPP